MDLRYPSVLCFLAVASLCNAQFPVESEAYHAWKLTQVQYPQPPVHPQAGQEGTGSLRDEPCACWIDPDSSYTLALEPNDDGSSGIINLPFEFSLYGEPYSTCYVNNNGNVSFQNPYGTYSASPFPTMSFKMIAPFWADVDTRGDNGSNGGTVQYRVTPHALYVNWTDVGYYSMQVDKINRFQLIISDGTDPAIPGGNNVSFCYGDMQWTTGAASMGVNGFGGIPAIVGANKGDGLDFLQFGAFDHDSTDWDGPFDNADGVGWLVDRHFSFSTSNEEIAPIFTSIGCDTLEIEPGTSFDYPMMIIAGGPGQVITATSQYSGISNYVETMNISGSTAQILSTITPDPNESGIQTITYSAQNNAVPPQVSTYTVYVKMLDITTGIRGASGAGMLTMRPNPATDEVTLTWPLDQRPTLVQVIAADGSVVISKVPITGASRMKLDVRNIASGLYTVRAISAAGANTLKLVRTTDR